MESTIHWHKHGYSLTLLILKCWQTLGVPVTLIKVFEFCVVLVWTHWYRDFDKDDMGFSLCMHIHFRHRNIFSPIGMLYNVPLV